MHYPRSRTNRPGWTIPTGEHFPERIPRKGDPPVIYITEDQAAQVQYLIQQAIQGNHVLFDSAHLEKAVRVLAARRATVDALGGNSEEVASSYGVEHHIEKLMSLKTQPEKRAYFEQLDEETFAAVVRTYFNIVENSLYEARKVTH